MKETKETETARRAARRDEIARAAARDEANRRMRKASRTAWDEDDYALAVATYNNLIPEPKELGL